MKMIAFQDQIENTKSKSDKKLQKKLDLREYEEHLKLKEAVESDPTHACLEKNAVQLMPLSKKKNHF